MNTQDLIAEFRRDYPDGKIAIENEGREIICELSNVDSGGEPTGRALAWIVSSAAHFHVRTKETYMVRRGRLLMVVAGQGHVVHEGGTVVVYPGLVHHARGLDGPTLVEVLSTPPWQPTDHFLV